MESKDGLRQVQTCQGSVEVKDESSNVVVCKMCPRGFVTDALTFARSCRNLERVSGATLEDPFLSFSPLGGHPRENKCFPYECRLVRRGVRRASRLRQIRHHGKGADFQDSAVSLATARGLSL